MPYYKYDRNSEDLLDVEAEFMFNFELQLEGACHFLSIFRKTINEVDIYLIKNEYIF